MKKRYSIVLVCGMFLSHIASVSAETNNAKQLDATPFLDRAKVALKETLELCKNDSQLNVLADKNIHETLWRTNGSLRVSSKDISIVVAIGPPLPQKPEINTLYTTFTTQVSNTSITISSKIRPFTTNDPPRILLLPPGFSDDKSLWPDIRLRSYLKKTFKEQNLDLRIKKET